MADMVLIEGLLRDDVARDLIFTDRQFTGEEALGWA